MASCQSQKWLTLQEQEDKDELIIDRLAVSALESEIANVNPIMVCGQVGIGKSYLMNSLMRAQAFGVSSQVSGCTKGVDIYPSLVPLEDFGGPAGGPKLLFMDMEGQRENGIVYDVKLATPILLISKIVIMVNICPDRPSKDDILDSLEVLRMAAESIQAEGRESKNFGSLHIILRDCHQNEADCADLLFGQEDGAVAATKVGRGAIAKRNAIRDSLMTFFETPPVVWCLPKLPQNAPVDYRDCRDARFGNAGTLFADKVDEIRRRMVTQLEEPKIFGNDQPLTGQFLVELMPYLAEAVGGDSPCINPVSLAEAAVERAARRIEIEIMDLARVELNALQLPMKHESLRDRLSHIQEFFKADLKRRLHVMPNPCAETAVERLQQHLGDLVLAITATNWLQLRDYVKEVETRIQVDVLKHFDELQALLPFESVRLQEEINGVREFLCAKLGSELEIVDDVSSIKISNRLITYLESSIQSLTLKNDVKVNEQIKEVTTHTPVSTKACKDGLASCSWFRC